jgi:hypothetical protein
MVPCAHLNSVIPFIHVLDLLVSTVPSLEPTAGAISIKKKSDCECDYPGFSNIVWTKDLKCVGPLSYYYCVRCHYFSNSIIGGWGRGWCKGVCSVAGASAEQIHCSLEGGKGD